MICGVKSPSLHLRLETSDSKNSKPRHRSGGSPGNKSVAKGRDHEIVRAIETLSKEVIPQKIEFVW